MQGRWRRRRKLQHLFITPNLNLSRVIQCVEHQLMRVALLSRPSCSGAGCWHLLTAAAVGGGGAGLRCLAACCTESRPALRQPLGSRKEGQLEPSQWERLPETRGTSQRPASPGGVRGSRLSRLCSAQQVPAAAFAL